jgi:hypothetical protein
MLRVGHVQKCTPLTSISKFCSFRISEQHLGYRIVTTPNMPGVFLLFGFTDSKVFDWFQKSSASQEV